MTKSNPPLHHLVACDFDQTLSYNDSGHVLAELIGVPDFQGKVDGLANTNLVHSGGELAYLIRHDPAFRGVRREHLEEAGRQVQLKHDIPQLIEVLDQGCEGHRFSFFVVSAAPREVILSALHGMVPADHIIGTELDYDPDTGEVRSVVHVPAGYGKVAVIQGLEASLGTAPGRTIYVGDGRSDVHVMLHVNNRGGFTIAVSENRYLERIAKTTVLSDSAFSVLVPVLDQIVGYGPDRIRTVFESRGLALQEWERDGRDRVSVHAVS